jgi:zinc protease
MTKPVEKITLANGLTVLLKEIHTAPIVSHWVWYRVGSRNEVAGLTGASHWVEHMLFKGTPDFPPSVLDKAVSRDGGYWNALTYLDWTTFFETMPADKIDLALRLEADRMANALFEPQEVASERTVIISERQGNENEPTFLLSEEVQAAAFRVHPYHHEVIGDMADLERMSRDDLYNHYRRYYTPNNAVLAVAGDFDSQQMLKRIEALYGAIPSGPALAWQPRLEPPARGERRVTVEGPGDATYMLISYRAPSAGEADFFPFTVMDSLLSGASSLNLFGGGISNKTSRLYQALVEKEYAVAVSGGLQATIDPFLYTVNLVLHPQRTPEETLAAFDEQVEVICAAPLPEQDLARALKQAKALFAYGSESITNQAFWLGFAEMFASYDWFLSYLDRLAAVTPEQVMETARKYLRRQNRVVGVYLPDGSEQQVEEVEE